MTSTDVPIFLGPANKRNTSAEALLLHHKMLEHASAALVALYPGRGGKVTKKGIKLPTDVVSFETESFAILKAILFALSVRSPVIVFSDSLSALQALKNKRGEEPFFKFLRDLLNRRGRNISFAWVPGHSGVLGNEWAHDYARKRFPPQRRTENIPMACYLFRSREKIFKDNAKSAWRNDSSFLASHWKETVAPTYDSRLTRAEGIQILRARLGHTLLIHEHHFIHSPRAGCSICQVPISIRHILRDYPATVKIHGGPLPPLSNLLNPSDGEPLLNLLEKLNLKNRL